MTVDMDHGELSVQVGNSPNWCTKTGGVWRDPSHRLGVPGNGIESISPAQAPAEEANEWPTGRDLALRYYSPIIPHNASSCLISTHIFDK